MQGERLWRRGDHGHADADVGLLAKAEGTRAQGEADGKAVSAKLLAEAEGRKQLELAIATGILKKNEAMARMSPQALQILLR